ncbi:sugar transporter SWEET1 isoform X1 [Caretta caretta]|uniref:sugar transporter SWEET1 isoform X1 n=1 Tax=Caretta caretta TaxID=8467 RepID=UPI0020944056|nr:sugar transporter SWEET1 isoform X2 [Caretta caretta]
MGSSWHGWASTVWPTPSCPQSRGFLKERRPRDRQGWGEAGSVCQHFSAVVRAGNLRLAGAGKLPRFIHPTAAGSRSLSADAAGGGAASAGRVPSGAGNLSWLSYGCLKQDWTLITVNAIGAALQTLYILVYLYFSPEKRRVLLQSVALLGVLTLGFCYFNLLTPDVDVRLAHLGLFCSVFTISMYLSPLAVLAKVIRTRSTRCLSFPLTVATFLASASWTLYGLQLNDLYIMVPNVPGIVTSILRLWLFWQFPPDQDKLYKPLQA